jgi:hypothetical protein
MEYIRVHFDPHDIRWVLANGSIVGATESELTLPSNFYVVTLSGDGYAPPDWSGVISALTSATRYQFGSPEPDWRR